jgi:hypothetical protein
MDNVVPTVPGSGLMSSTALLVPLTNAKRSVFYCVVAGKWQSMGGGVTT